MKFDIENFQIEVKTKSVKFSPTKANDYLSMKVKQYVTYPEICNKNHHSEKFMS